MLDIVETFKKNGIDCSDWVYYRVPDWYIREAKYGRGKIKWFHVPVRFKLLSNKDFEEKDYFAELFIPKSILITNGTFDENSEDYFMKNGLFKEFEINVEEWDEVVRICWDPYRNSSEVGSDINELLRTVIIKTIFKCTFLTFSQE